MISANKCNKVVHTSTNGNPFESAPHITSGPCAESERLTLPQRVDDDSTWMNGWLVGRLVA